MGEGTYLVVCLCLTVHDLIKVMAKQLVTSGSHLPGIAMFVMASEGLGELGSDKLHVFVFPCFTDCNVKLSQNLETIPEVGGHVPVELLTGESG